MRCRLSVCDAAGFRLSFGIGKQRIGRAGRGMAISTCGGCAESRRSIQSASCVFRPTNSGRSDRPVRYCGWRIRAGGGKADSKVSEDTEYQSLLNARDGVMGAIRILQLSIDLPIYHGTDEQSLMKGAGHLYGTSLPVGGPSTHSVIAGHRGLVESLMFTRIDEMRKGDYFYLDVMGRTLAYQVDHIWVIDPEDTSKLRVTPDEDRVTLLTCTPYGVNTQRLLVSGIRVPMPGVAPKPSDIHDARVIGLWIGIGTFILGLAVIAVRWRRRMFFDIRARHANEMFWRGGRYGR